MSTSDDIHLDLQVIAGLLGPEDLDPPSSKPTDQNDSTHSDNTTQPIEQAEGVPTQNVLKQREATPSSPKQMQQDQEDFNIPGLEPCNVVASEVPAADKPISPTEIGTDTVVMPTEVVTSSSSGELSKTALNTILAKHNLQMITSESSEEGDDTSEESDETTSETDSDDSDSADSADSDSDSTSSGASSNLPMEGDAGNSDTEASRLKSQHKKNKAKLNNMVQDDADPEDGLDLPSGTQPIAMFATVHEIIAPQVNMPSITEIPDDEPIELIGEVMNIVDSVVVVKSMSNGMQRVLDTDSLLVLENRKVLGLVFETFGPLTAPLYSIRFPSSAHFPSAISALAESLNDRLKVYYCPSRSTFAYTSQLLLNHGNDASNLYDEEVAENELEFSDDEVEREWKRKYDKGAAGGKRKRRPGSKASSRAGSTYAHSPRLGESSALPYGDEMDGVMPTEGDTSLSYVDPYQDEPISPTQLSPSTSNGPSIRAQGLSSVDPPSQLPPRPNNNRGSYDRARGRGRGRGQGNFSGDRGRGRGRGQSQQPHERGRQRSRGQAPMTTMGPPVMTGHSNHAEYNPSYAGNFPHNMSPFMPMAPSVPMHHSSGSSLGAPHMGGIEFQGSFNGIQPPQTFGMQNGPMHQGSGMYGGAPPMYAMGRGPGMPPFMNGPAPGAYVNPRFAMMQPPAPGSRGGPTPGPYQGGENFQPLRQNP